MNPIAEGVIRYDASDFRPGPPLPRAEFAVLEGYRRLLHRHRLIGVYEDGLGYGNVSMRRDYLRFLAAPRPQFLITGTQTGHLTELTGAHYVRVLDFDLARFRVTAAGPLPASSETVTHAAIYAVNPAVRAVIHGHHRALWQGMLRDGWPATSRWTPYGTAEMAREVELCVGSTAQGLIVMAGHEEGVIAYGPSLSAAMGQIARVWRRYVAADFAC